MDRNTKYVRGYGYVTQSGDGLFDTVIDGLKTIATSKAVIDAGSEALKAGAKSAGDKLGAKIVERAFKKKETMKMPKSKKLLDDIYGQSIFGSGLKRAI